MTKSSDLFGKIGNLANKKREPYGSLLHLSILRINDNLLDSSSHPHDHGHELHYKHNHGR